MSNPITWQNINAPNNMDASQQMQAASNSFNNAFSGLQGALQQNDQIEAKKFDKQKILNTQSYLNQVDELGKTPEQLQAAIQSGALDKLRQSFGDNIDHAAVRGAGESLLNQRYQQAKAATEYNHMATDERTAPIAEAYKAAVLKGDTAGADALYQEALAAGLRKPSELNQFADTRGQQVKERGHQDKNQQISVTKAADDLLTSANQRANQTTQAKASLMSAGAAVSNSATQAKLANEQIIGMKDSREQVRKTYDSQLSAAQAAGLKSKLSEEGNIYAEGVYSGKELDKFTKLMADNQIGGKDNYDTQAKRAKIIERFKDGVIEISAPNGGKMTVPIPYSALKAAVLGATNTTWSWNAGYADAAEANLRNMLEQTVNTKDNGPRNVAEIAFTEYQNAIGKVADNPVLNPKLKVPSGAQVPPAPISTTEDFKKKVMRLTESTRPARQ